MDYYNAITKNIEEKIRISESFDLLLRNLVVGGKNAKLYLVDGFAKEEVMEKVLAKIMSLKAEDLDDIENAEGFSSHFITYIEVDIQDNINKIITQILSGTLALIIDGFKQAIMIDARTYPITDAPEDDRVLRGARDGFTQTLVTNTTLVRRRIRDPHLTMEITQVGKSSKTDIVLCYMSNKVDKQLLEKLRDALARIEINTLSMAQESLAECLVKRQWYNPFPKVRYTERPDSAAASVSEGKILAIVDNSPSVMVLPTSIFDFIQDTNDYYFPPLVGSYLRFVRMLVFFATLMLTPIWYLLIQNPEYIPSWLDFIKINEPTSMPVIAQLIIIEFVIDGLKLASLNTPSMLSNSFSVVGALILGDFAVQAGWFVPEVVLYMAFVAIATFTQPSFELGFAFKLMRMLILVLTAIFNVWGFAGGVILTLVLIASTSTVMQKSYLYPLFPFNWKALSGLLIRKPIDKSHN